MSRSLHAAPGSQLQRRVKATKKRTREQTQSLDSILLDPNLAWISPGTTLLTTPKQCFELKKQMREPPPYTTPGPGPCKTPENNTKRSSTRHIHCIIRYRYCCCHHTQYDARKTNRSRLFAVGLDLVLLAVEPAPREEPDRPYPCLHDGPEHAWETVSGRLRGCGSWRGESDLCRLSGLGYLCSRSMQ
jgi:hypothetical protein